MTTHLVRPPIRPTRMLARESRHVPLAVAAIAGAVALAALVGLGLAVYFLAERQMPPSSGPVTQASPSPNPLATGDVDVDWRPVAGASLPFSRLNGPRVTKTGQAGGYSRSEKGAAVAAVQVLARTSATAGPRIYSPVLASQMTGANLPAMKLALDAEYQRLRASTTVEDGAPLPGSTARVAGYVVVAYSPQAESAVVDVVLTSSDLAATGRFVAFRVSLVWGNADWRVVAPPDGDWGSVATTLGAAPAGLLDYGG